MNEKDEKQIEEETAVTQEKDMHGAMLEYMPAGVMSFSELDAVERAQEQHSKLRKIVDAFARMAANIVQNPAIDPGERSAALRGLTEEMRMRLDADFERGERSISLPTIDGKLDREYLEKLLSSDEIYKATKTEGGIEYQASDYADVPDVNMPSTWKLRLAENRSGNFTVAQVARAITAMQPGGFRGNRVELGQSKAIVTGKIARVIRGLDATDEQKQNLMQRLDAVKAINFDTDTGFKVLQVKNGDYRWVGWVSNKFIDREGEILTDDAHKDYVAWLDANPKAAGKLWTFHIPGTDRESKADFWTYLNGFLVVGGKLTELEAEALKEKKDLAMSHGFYVLQKEGNLITKYRTFEYTVLPRKWAANPWTRFDTKGLSNMQKLTDEQRAFATQLHGADFVEALERDTQKMATVLDEAGVQSKADKKEIPDDAEPIEEVPAPEVENFNVGDLAKSVAELVTKQLNPEGLHEAVKTIHEQGVNNATAIENIVKRLELLEKTDDEKLAKQLEPKGIQWLDAGFRASQSEKTKVTEDEKEKFDKAKPNESWLEQTGAFSLGGQ